MHLLWAAAHIPSVIAGYSSLVYLLFKTLVHGRTEEGLNTNK